MEWKYFMTNGKNHVMFVSDEGYAVVHGKGLFVITNDNKREFASKYFDKFGDEYWYLKIPIFNLDDKIYFLSDCQIDWDKVDPRVLQIQVG